MLTTSVQSMRTTQRSLGVVVLALATIWIIWRPAFAFDTARFVVRSMLHVTPLVIPGILLAAWLSASSASERVASAFHGRTLQAVLAATLVGALLPICGITVLPLMAGLLAAGVPLAPVMAFWLASPITGPALLAATVATLGFEFALGKALAAIGLGLLGGGVTWALSHKQWVRSPLRSNRWVGALGERSCAKRNETGALVVTFWREPWRRARFVNECWSMTRLMLLVLSPAFAAEFALNAWLQPQALATYVGQENWFAIPLVVIIGGPAYIDGFAALPLTRALLAHGMSNGAAMAFLVSGAVVSIWGAMAIFPVLRLQPFILYLALAAFGSMAAGWVYGAMF